MKTFALAATLPVLALAAISVQADTLQSDTVLGDWSIPFDTTINPITSTTPITATFQLPVGGVIEEVDFSFWARLQETPLIHVELTQGGTCYGSWNVSPVLPDSFDMFFLTPAISQCSPSNPRLAANQDTQLVASTTDSNPADYAWLTNPEGALAYQFRWFPRADPVAPDPAASSPASSPVPEPASLPLMALGILVLSALRVQWRRRSSSAAQSQSRLA